MELGRVGVWVSSREVAGPRFAADLEELGFGALWLGGAAGDLGLVSELLGATSRMPVATGIVNIWAWPPDQVAAAFASVTARHPGRLLLGLGAGHRAMVGEAYQHPYHRLSSYVDDLTGVPAGNIVLAALGPRTLRLAARRTAGAHPYLVTPDHTRIAREILGSGPLLAPEQTVLLETDPAKARALARAWLDGYLKLENYTNNWLRLGFTPDDLSGSGSDRLVDALVAWGDAGAIAARVDEHLQAGADHVALQLLGAEGRRTSYEALAVALA